MSVGESAAPAPRFGILGPLQVLDNGRPVALGPRKQQQVLALLLCNANSLVTVDALVDALWEDRPPRTARKNLQVYVSGLRALLGAESPHRITHRLGGYVLSVDDGELDWLRFEQKVRDSRRLGARVRPSAVARLLTEALALWRGPVLDGMRGAVAIDEVAQRLENRILAVFEDWAEAELAAGASLEAAERTAEAGERTAEVGERIAEVAEQHPFRERLRMAQMNALSRIGRRAEALAVFDELRLSLAGEFGLEPGAAVAELHRSLLAAQEPPPAPRAEQTGRGPAAGCMLPRDIGAFIGREEHTRELVDALTVSGERLVVLSGPVGVGKTTLAIHAAHRLRERFPDGCCAVRLRAEDGEPRPLRELASQLMWVIGDPGTVPRPDPLAAWQRWLAAHRALVVLDDARREAEIRPLLPETGQSAVIVTAQTRLAGLGGAHRLSLPVFSTDQALDLLRRIIGDRRVDSDQKSAERIVRAVGRLPLAVRVVGEKLAGLNHLPLHEYRTRVEAASNLLDELTVGDMAVRARVAAAIADLPTGANHAFRRLATLPRLCFTLREGAMALNVDEDTAVRTLESLLEVCLLAAPDAETVAHEVVYEVPPLIHAYACELAVGRSAHTGVSL